MVGTWRSHLVAFVIGATVGSLLDALHTHSGTTRYPDPGFLQMATWTPLLFGAAGAAVLASYAALEDVLDRPIHPRASHGALVAAAIAFVLLYAASGFLPAGNPTKLALLAGAALVLWAWLGRTLETAALSLLAALLGPTVEITLTGAGAFAHLQPDFWRIPMWLPALYACAPLALGPWGAWLHGTRGRWR